jgi:hypothetical protein
MYIKQGRFGKFVKEFLESEYNRKKDKDAEDKEWKLWVAYVHSYSEEPYGIWKQKVDGSSEANGNDSNLDDKGIKSIIDNLFPEDGGETL